MTKITFGLTGGIACGKSTVTKTLREHNIPIVDADIIARQIVEPGTIGLQFITNIFGTSYLNEDGTLNRTALGNHVFGNPKELEKLDVLMKPLLIAESTKQLEALHAQGHELVGYDAALIIEMGNFEKYRPLIVVHCPRVTQIERLIKRNALTEAEAIARIDAQLPVEQKVKMADYAIDTSGTIENSIDQTIDIIDKLTVKLLKLKLDSKEITYDQVPRKYRW